MITDRARQLTSGIVAPIADTLARWGVKPNALTIVGTLLHVGVAGLLATGHLLGGGLLLAFAAAFDGLDGAVARRSGGVTPFGAFLDSSMDRVSEILVAVGLLVYMLRQPPVPGCQWCAHGPVLVLAAITGSLMVSYTRARSESIGHGTKVGVLGRLERMAILVVALVLGHPAPGLAIVAVGAWITAAQRMVDVRWQCRKDDAP